MPARRDFREEVRRVELDRSQAPIAAEAIVSLLRLPAVLRITGLGRSTLYKMIAEQAFPKQRKIGKRAVGWRDDEVHGWTRQRPIASLPSTPFVKTPPARTRRGA